MGKIIPRTMGIQWRWMIFFGALAQCSSAASSSKRAENIKTLLTKQEVIRADKYIANAQHHFGQYQKVLREEMEGDLFLHCWATTQQILAAIDFNDFRDPKIVAAALTMSIALLDSPEGAVIQVPEILDWTTRTAALHSSAKPQLAKLMQTAVRAEQISRESKQQFTQLAKLLAKPHADVPPPRNPLVRQDWGVPNPAAPRCAADGTDDCDQIVLETHALFPTVVSTVQGAVPVAMRKALSKTAIKKFRMFASRSDSPEGANNRFFSWQPKSEDEILDRSGSWPELYESTAYAKLREVAKKACIEHAIRTGSYEDRAELEPLSLVLWAAVYLNGTAHSTHVHEQSVCSGVFYSQVADDAPTPIEFSDPRGLSAMGIDTTQAELEPLAPFHQRVHFAPRSGDMVLFPSYLPHRISKHESPPKGERVAWAFNLEGGVDTWARMVTPVPKRKKGN